MVTTTPKEPTIEAPDPPHYEPDMPMAFGSELRLNLKALGVDGSAPDFGERLVQLTQDNEPYDFQFSAQGELIVMAPSGALSNRDETVINADLEMYNRQHPGMCFSQTIGFRLPSGAQLMPDAAWITQERFDNLTERNCMAPSTARLTSWWKSVPAATGCRRCCQKWRSGWKAAPAWAGCWMPLTVASISFALCVRWKY